MAGGDLTVYSEGTTVIEAQYDPESDEALSEAIVDAVAAVAGMHASELPPLYDYVDLEAVDMLLDRDDVPANGTILLVFQVEDWNVFVRDDGRIRVCDGTQRSNPEPVFDPQPP